MKFWYGVLLHWRMNTRNKEFLIHYYIVPLLFYIFMGFVFTTIMPEARNTLIQSMIVFGITMGGVLGTPNAVIEIFGSDCKRAYQIGNIPLWSVVLAIYVSSIIHLIIVSMIIFVSAPIVFGALIPVNLLAFFIGLLLVIGASSGIGVVFGLYVHSISKVGMATQLVFLPSIILSGIMFPISLLPDFLQWVSKWIPATLGYQIMISNRVAIMDVFLLIVLIGILVVMSNFKLKNSFE